VVPVIDGSAARVVDQPRPGVNEMVAKKRKIAEGDKPPDATATGGR